MSEKLSLGRWPLGLGDVCFYPRLDNYRCAEMGAMLGFHHLDLHSYWDDGDESKLALPIGNRIVNTGTAKTELSELASDGERLAQWPVPRPGWGYVPPPARFEGAWELTVRLLRECPTAVTEPWAGSVLATNAQTKELLKEVPGLRLIVDVGHLVFRDEDPYELLEFADIVQLRDCAPSRQQLPVGEGVMDFKKVKAELERLDYQGLITVEYFDLPWVGYPSQTPFYDTLTLAHYLNGL
jgi:xylose isomerase-like TIM barrel protein